MLIRRMAKFITFHSCRGEVQVYKTQPSSLVPQDLHQQEGPLNTSGASSSEVRQTARTARLEPVVQVNT